MADLAGGRRQSACRDRRRPWPRATRRTAHTAARWPAAPARSHEDAVVDGRRRPADRQRSAGTRQACGGVVRRNVKRRCASQPATMATEMATSTRGYRVQAEHSRQQLRAPRHRRGTRAPPENRKPSPCRTGCWPPGASAVHLPVMLAGPASRDQSTGGAVGAARGPPDALAAASHRASARHTPCAAARPPGRGRPAPRRDGRGGT